MSRPTWEQPLALRVRPDLSYHFTPLRHGDCWFVQDPISLRAYQLRHEEYFILRAIDGRSSLADIKQRFERQFAPRKLLLPHIQAFLTMLHRENLVLADAEHQGHVLLERRQAGRRRELWQRLSNPFAVRLPGWNPDRPLSWLLARCGWLFSRTTLGIFVLLVLSAIVLVVARWQFIMEEVSPLRNDFQARHAVWLAVAIGLSKVLHELGHGLTCKRMGVRCREWGMMLLVFVPCLYCNVSDAWLLPNKWQRMAITAAGVGVELILAAVCLWGWWWSVPGDFHRFCLTMAMVCSANTLLMNGNPLLRFDGYHLLADYVEIPNLAQNAQAACANRWNRCWGLGDGTRKPSALVADSWWLVAYGIAAFFYRWVVMGVILVAVYAALEPRGLTVVAYGLGMLMVWSSVLMPAYRAVQRVADRQRGRFRIRGLVPLTLVLAWMAVMVVPFQRREYVPVRIEPQDVEHVYVTVPGLLTAAVGESELVTQGQVLARLQDLALTQQVASLRGQCGEQEALVRNLRRLLAVVDGVDAELSAAESVLKDLREQLRHGESRLGELTVVAPRAGNVLAPPIRDLSEAPRELGAWQGTPLDANNAGAYLEKGTWLCSVGDPRRLEAIAVIQPGQLTRLRVGQVAIVRLDALPGQLLRGAVVELAEADQDAGSAETDQHGLGSPETDVRSCYRARIALEECQVPVRLASLGWARINVPAESLAVSCYRYLRRTFAVFL